MVPVTADLPEEPFRLDAETEPTPDTLELPERVSAAPPWAETLPEPVTSDDPFADFVPAAVAEPEAATDDAPVPPF
jgi:hypothetical protein